MSVLLRLCEDIHSFLLELHMQDRREDLREQAQRDIVDTHTYLCVFRENVCVWVGVTEL